MKRDDDLVRKIILKVEGEGESPNGWVENWSIEGVTDKALSYHVWLLADASYLLAQDLSTSDSDYFVPRCLTSKGHDFADAIRDAIIWKETKEAARASGSAAIDLLGKIAMALVRQKIKEKTGLEV